MRILRMPQVVFVIVIASFVLRTRTASAALGDERWYDLAAGAVDSSRLVVRVIPGGKTPRGWHVSWRVAIYSPRGLRLPLGNIEDPAGPFDHGRRLFTQMPPGRYRVEIARVPDEDTGDRHFNGMFDFSSQRPQWVPPNDRPEAIASIEADLAPGKTTVLAFSYEEPKLVAKPVAGQAIYAMANPRLAASSEASPTPPRTKASRFPFLATRGLAALDWTDLLGAFARQAKSDKGGEEDAEIAASIIVFSDRLPLGPIGAALLTRVNDLSPTWALARTVVRIGGADMSKLATTLIANTSADRGPLLWTLGQLKVPSSVETLSGALARGTPMERLYSAYGLAQIGSAAGVPALVESIGDKTCFRRKGFVTVAVDINPWMAFDSKNWQKMLPLPSLCVDKLSVYALGQIGGPIADRQAFDAIRIASESKDSDLAEEAIEALASFEAKDSAVPLIERLKEKPKVAFVAVAAIDHVHATDAIKPLTELETKTKDKVFHDLIQTTLASLRKPTEIARTQNGSPKDGARNVDGSANTHGEMGSDRRPADGSSPVAFSAPQSPVSNKAAATTTGCGCSIDDAGSQTASNITLAVLALLEISMRRQRRSLRNPLVGRERRRVPSPPVADVIQERDPSGASARVVLHITGASR